MFRVKICGITNGDDARMVAAAGADAVGLNFFPASPRFIDVATARTIIENLPPEMTKVGLFVNATAKHIHEIVSQLPLDMIQLHGDEPPEFLAELSLPVMKAFRIGEAGLLPVVEWLDRCRELGRLPIACLLDAFKPGQFGGTGKTLDWRALAAEKTALRLHIESQKLPVVPLVLSGGLNSSNVAEAILMFQPNAVDTASGVENSPGKKDATLVQAFVSAARATLFDVRDGIKLAGESPI